MRLCLGCLRCPWQEAEDSGLTFRIGKEIVFLFNRLGKHDRLGTISDTNAKILLTAGQKGRSGREGSV